MVGSVITTWSHIAKREPSPTAALTALANFLEFLGERYLSPANAVSLLRLAFPHARSVVMKRSSIGKSMCGGPDVLMPSTTTLFSQSDAARAHEWIVATN